MSASAIGSEGSTTCSDDPAVLIEGPLYRGYDSPSAPPRVRPSRFLMAKFWQVCVSPVEPHIKGGRRRWFNVERAENRTFQVLYGFNPRCCHKGSYGKPGTFHWRRDQ